MFWGLTLETGKHYSQTVEDSFHVTMAALELDDNYNAIKSSGPPVRVMVQHDKKEFLICSLIDRSLVQQLLDLNFTEGEQVTFYVEGKGVVHLTGSLVQEEPFDMDEEQVLDSPSDSEEDGMELTDDSEDSHQDEDIPSLQHLATGEDVDSSDADSTDWTPDLMVPGKKRKLEEKTPPHQKKIKKEGSDQAIEQEDDDSDEDSADDIADQVAKPAENVSKERTEQSDESSTKKKRKRQRKKKKQPESGKKQEDGKQKEDVKENEENSDKSEGTSPAKPSQSLQAATPKGSAQKSNKKETKAKTPMSQKKKLSSGVVIEDVIIGEGKIAKANRMVGVYYKGVLAKSNKQFDSCTSGKPFEFRLGSQEVIAGWDSGVAGMRVGGKRKLIIPASQGYGNKKMGPIPPNSTLVFNVELKHVK